MQRRQPLRRQKETIHPRYASEVEAIARRASVQRAFRVIETLEPRTQEDLVYLTEIPAPPFGEADRAAAYLEMLREAGVDTAYIDDEGNAVAVRRGASGERTVAVSGHLDSVFQEGTDVSVRTRGDTLFAPGVGDDSRGLVVALTVLRAMHAALADRGAAALELELDRVGDRPSGVISPDQPLVQRAMAAARFMGFEPELARASTDANVPISLGIPAVTTGRGGAGGGAHSLGEWWLNEAGHLAIQRTVLLLLAEAVLPE